MHECIQIPLPETLRWLELCLVCVLDRFSRHPPQCKRSPALQRLQFVAPVSLEEGKSAQLVNILPIVQVYHSCVYMHVFQ